MHQARAVRPRPMASREVATLPSKLESIARSQPTAALWFYRLEIVLLSMVCDLLPQSRALCVRREEVDPCVDSGELDFLDGLRELRERPGDPERRVRGAEGHLIRPVEVLQRLDERGAHAAVPRGVVRVRRVA